MALATAEALPPPPSWRRLGTPCLRQLRPRPSAAVWAVWDALCDLQAGRHELVRGGVIALVKATGLHPRTVERALVWLEARAVIVTRTHGGGRVLDPARDSPGNANQYDLGDLVRQSRAGLRVVKNPGETTGVEPRRNDRGSLAKNPGETTGVEPRRNDRATSSTSSGSLNPPPSTPDVEEGWDHESTYPGDRPRGGEPTRLGRILQAGPQPVPLKPPGGAGSGLSGVAPGGIADEPGTLAPLVDRSNSVERNDREQGDDVVGESAASDGPMVPRQTDLQRLLATESVEKAPQLDMGPPKRRRR